MQFCTYCGQSFTRSEHLERHILTHTKVKPHKCSICHVSFTRRDLLQKHSRSHGQALQNRTSHPGTSDFSTLRALVACDSCVKRKVRCDNNYPCSRCSTRKLACNSRALQRTCKDATSSETLSVASTLHSYDARQDHPAEPFHSDTNLFSTSSDWAGIASTHAHDLPTGNHLQGGQDALPGVTTGVQKASESTEMRDVQYDSMHIPDTGSEVVAPGYLNVLDLDSYFLMDWSDYPSHLAPMGIVEDANACLSDNTSNTLGQDHTVARQSDDDDALAPDGSLDPEHPEVIVGREHWNVFKCNPPRPPGACPKTARVFLQNLARAPEENGILTSWQTRSDQGSPSPATTTDLPQILESTRDKLLAVSQSFVLKAHEIHTLGESTHNAEMTATGPDQSVALLNLPSRYYLEIFLKSFLRNFNTFYSTFPAGKMDVNSLMMHNNNKTSALLVLFAIAQGAMTDQSLEGLRLSGGLTEVCRISLFDIIEKDILLTRDQLVIQSALIFSIQSSWSGDKWLMDIGTGQRGIYVAMLRHGGGFDAQAPLASILPNITSLEHSWNVWQLRESRVRLIYSWVIADQEHSLFNDRAPLISVTELNTALANADDLWHAKTALLWQEILVKRYQYDPTGLPGVFLPKQKPSLCELFADFLNDDISPSDTQLSPLMLRLLLYPIQGQVCHMRQLLTCFGPHPKSSRTYRSVSKTSVQLRLEEVQSLLYRWYSLWEAVASREDQTCPTFQVTLILYHLIRLDTISSFGMIEKTARDYSPSLSTEANWDPRTLLQEPQEAVVQAGQVLRFVDALPRDSRPPWWPGAIYRAALILWGYSLMHGLSQPSSMQLSSLETPTQYNRIEDNSALFRIDVVSEGDEMIRRFERYNEGRPALGDENGTECPLLDPKRTLQLCILFLDRGVSTRFSEGIKAKLCLLSTAGS